MLHHLADIWLMATDAEVARLLEVYSGLLQRPYLPLTVFLNVTQWCPPVVLYELGFINPVPALLARGTERTWLVDNTFVQDAPLC